MNNQRLQDAFIFVRATFFPGWDIKKEWKVKHDPEMPRQENIENKELYEFLKKAGVPYQQDAYAQNYSNEKIIVVFKMPKANKFLYELLIHEICHSHGSGGHGKIWQSKMKKAHIKVLEHGFKDLADLMEIDMVRYINDTTEREIAKSCDKVLTEIKSKMGGY